MRFAGQTAVFSVFSVFSLLVTFAPGIGRAQAPAAEVLEEARALERSLDIDRALVLYESAAASGAGTRAGRRAEERAAHLGELRDPDGGFRSLIALERMRQDDESEARLRAFSAEVDAMPPGGARDDALLLLGEAWFRRRADPERALPYYERLQRSETIGRDRGRTVSVAIAEARAAIGETSEALAELEREGLDRTFEGRALSAEAARQKARMIATAVLVIAIAIIFAIGRPWRARGGARRLVTRARILAVVYVLAIPAVVAELYEPTMSHVFLFYAVLAVPLLGLAAASGVALEGRTAVSRSRTAVVGALVCAQAAAAWLALDAANGLGGFFGFP